jgi:hypothetical protein
LRALAKCASPKPELTPANRHLYDGCLTEAAPEAGDDVRYIAPASAGTEFALCAHSTGMRIVGARVLCNLWLLEVMCLIQGATGWPFVP